MLNQESVTAPSFSFAIHPTAQIDPEARLGKNVRVGAFAVIGPHVTIGDGTEVGSRVTLDGWTTIGDENRFYPGAVIGTAPQDVRYKGEESYVTIGHRNTFREYVTVNRAHNEKGKTCIGNDNLFMACTHVAHNCILGNGIIMTNYSGLAGHVVMEDFVVLGGYAGVHQFVRVGTMAMVGGLAKVIKDIPPYATVDGQPARIYELNNIGLKRRGVKPPARAALRQAFKLLTRSGLNRQEAAAAIRRDVPSTPEVEHLVSFIEARSKMGLLIRFAQRHDDSRVLRGDGEGPGGGE